MMKDDLKQIHGFMTPSDDFSLFGVFIYWCEEVTNICLGILNVDPSTNSMSVQYLQTRFATGL